MRRDPSERAADAQMRGMAIASRWISSAAFLAPASVMETTFGDPLLGRERDRKHISLRAPFRMERCQPCALVEVAIEVVVAIRRILDIPPAIRGGAATPDERDRYRDETTG
jgi:hypothetical protein